MRRRLAISALCFVSCASSTTYNRRTLEPGELVWSVTDGALSVTKDGSSFGAASSWRGLSEAVACVPGARTRAAAAEAQVRSGRLTTWISVGVMVASTLAATVPFIAPTPSATEARSAQTAGLIVGVTGLFAGLIGFLVGILNESSGMAKAIDAVNIYRDGFRDAEGCVAAGPTAG